MPSTETRSNLLECGVLWATQKGDESKVNELIEDGVNCNVQDSDGLTPLHHAARDGNFSIVRLLLEAGADCNVTTYGSGYTPLHMTAVYNGYNTHSTVDALIKAGSYIDAVDFYGKTSLSHFALKGDQNLVSMLLYYNADPNIQDSCGWTALHWACSENHPETVKLLLQFGAKTNICENDSWAALHWAGFKALPEIVELLLLADAEYWQEDSEGFTPLNTAMLSSSNREQCLQVIKLLIEAGADVNHAGSIGWTALHRAAGEQESLDISRFLIKSGAIPDVQNISGDTPLHIATLARNVSMVQMLIQSGASMTIQDIEWKTPLQRAIESLYPDIIRPFFGAGAALKVRVVDVENTVMETIANYCRTGPTHSHKTDETAEVLYLLYEACILDYNITKRMLSLLQYTIPILTLKSLSRTCIHRYIHSHNEATYSQLGLPVVLQHYLHYQCN